MKRKTKGHLSPITNGAITGSSICMIKVIIAMLSSYRSELPRKRVEIFFLLLTGSLFGNVEAAGFYFQNTA